MAKRKSKSTAAAIDPVALSGIRMLAMDVERMATSAYITRPDRLGEIVRSLRNEVVALEDIGKKPRTMLAVCPPPYIDCDDLCVMFCEQEEPPSGLTRRTPGPQGPAARPAAKPGSKASKRRS